MSLTIENHTDWDGRDLRWLCRRVIEHTDGYFDRAITIRTSRSQNKEVRWEEGIDQNLYRGRASVGTRRYLYMGVPLPEREVNGKLLRHKFNAVQFARVLEHEILHNQGLRHGDMQDDVRYCNQEIDYDLSDLTVSTKPSWTPTENES